MAHIPDQLITGRVKDGVEGNSELDGAEIGAQVTAGLRDGGISLASRERSVSERFLRSAGPEIEDRIDIFKVLPEPPVLLNSHLKSVQIAARQTGHCPSTSRRETLTAGQEFASRWNYATGQPLSGSQRHPDHYRADSVLSRTCTGIVQFRVARH